MSIQFKTIKRKKPGDVGGDIRHYATPHHGREMNFDGIIQAIEKTYAATDGDILLILRALINETVAGLSEGRIIRLGELGSFRISLRSEGKDTPEQVTPKSIKKARVIFTPGKRLKDMLKAAKYEKYPKATPATPPAPQS